MWSLFDQKGELKPLVFSNGKSQKDIVEEVVKEIRNGRKIVFIRGVCGSGKSAMALNIASELGRASIVVPIKNLQRQYKEDYMAKKYVLKANGEKLRISMITGRNNFACPFLDENNGEIMQTVVKETNAKLFDVFEKKESEGDGETKKISQDKSCDNPKIPCKIEIKQKNIPTLRNYYKENPENQNLANLDIKTMKRMAVAPACPYWSPIYNSNLRINMKAETKKYNSINGESLIYARKEGCPYYQQFNSYIDSDVIIFNSRQYLLETFLGRKPATDVEIIDECDEFLDNFATEGIINLNHLKNETMSIFGKDSSEEKMVNNLIDAVSDIVREANSFSEREEIMPLKSTRVLELIKLLTKNDYDLFAAEDSYLEHCLEVCREFAELVDDSYVSFYKDRKKDELAVKLVTINLEKMFGTLLEKNRAFVMMSGTIHSEKVLKEIFGIKDFKIIEAETINQGTITRQYTKLEKDFKFDNFAKGNVSRKDYLQALDKCVEIAKRPTVVHVNAFQDLPSNVELFGFNLKNLVGSEELIEQQKNDKEGNLVMDFKKGKTNLLFTTRCNRGIDFPFETCNSVVITKFPYPNTQSLFWKILNKNKPQIFWEFYRDKAHRELLQKIYRSVRAKNDHIDLLSPDIRVLNTRVV